MESSQNNTRNNPLEPWKKTLELSKNRSAQAKVLWINDRPPTTTFYLVVPRNSKETKSFFSLLPNWNSPLGFFTRLLIIFTLNSWKKHHNLITPYSFGKYRILMNFVQNEGVLLHLNRIDSFFNSIQNSIYSYKTYIHSKCSNQASFDRFLNSGTIYYSWKAATFSREIWMAYLN